VTTIPTTTPPPTTTTKPPPTTSVTPPPTTTGSTVIVSGYTFSPDPILVRVGTRVVWKNLDAADHTVTSVSPGIFDNPLPSLGETSITFTVPGKYDYICTIHPYMTGSVIVS
jgi:plastocyanin